ncbi:MAG: PAS domain S-box protein [Desulfomonilaceae bacterium]
MAQDKRSKDNLSEVRRQAEQRAAEKQIDVSELSTASPEKLRQLIHELRVHQVEMELQNDELRRTQQELGASLDKYAELYDFAPIGYFTLGKNGVILEANLAAASLLGVEKGLLIGKPLASFVNQEDGDALHLHFRRVLATQSKQTCDVQIPKKDGNQVFVHLESQSIRNQDGLPDRFRTAAFDITDSKTAERELQGSRERYRAVFDNAAIGIDLVDDQGRFIDANAALLNMLGYTEEELRQLTKDDITHPDDREISKSKLDAIVRGEINSYRIEKRFIKKDGSVTWADISVSCIQDSEGKYVATVGLIADITDRKQSEDALLESEQQLSQIINFQPDATCAIDREGRVIAWNRAMEDMTGVPAQEMIGKGNYEYALPFYGTRRPVLVDLVLVRNEEILKNYSILEDGEGILTAETEISGPLGRNLIQWGKATPLYDTQGKIIGGIVSIRDITERKKAEEELRKSREVLELALKGADLGLWDMDVLKCSGTVNERAAQMVGYTLDEIEPTLGFFLDLVHPDDKSRVMELLASTLKGQIDFFEVEFRVLAKSGEWRWIYDRGKIVERDGSGSAVRMAGTFMDNTERKRSEEDLREANEVFYTFADQLPAKVFIKDHNSHLEYINKFLREVNDSEDWIGHDASEYFPPDAANMVLADDKKVFLEGQLVREEWIPDKKGVKRLWETRKFPIYREGKPPLLGGVSIDITDRKRVEEALRESSERLELALGGADLGLWDWNLKTGRAIWDERAMEMLGYMRGEVEFNLSFWKSSVHPEDWPKVSDTLNQHMEGRLPIYETEYRIRCKSGGWKWILARGKVVGYDTDGKPLRMVGTSLDITQRKSAEEDRERLKAQLLQAQKMEAIGTLAGGVAHDFNNLLTAVMGFSELLLAEKDPKHPEYADLQKIFQAARNGADLVQRLLMFSRKAEPKPVPMNLNKQIVQVEKMLRRIIPRMIDIKLELSADLPDIDADMSQIEQVLMNLAVNARDAMPDKGTLTVKTQAATVDDEYCRLHLVAKPGDYVLLEISDTGHGMDKETIEHIFEPFFTTKEMGRGTGLGLAMVHGTVTQHNGHVTVQSEIGKGTTFRVYLPALPASVESEVADSGVMPAFGTETLLLVEDEDFIRELGARILTKQGYTVLQVENGKEALDLFQKERSRISLVILDLIMPEMGGTECLKELLKIDPNVRVLIASGYSADVSVKETTEMGAKGFVTKPFRVKQLLRDVRKVLDEG